MVRPRKKSLCVSKDACASLVFQPRGRLLSLERAHRERWISLWAPTPYLYYPALGQLVVPWKGDQAHHSHTMKGGYFCGPLVSPSFLHPALGEVDVLLPYHPPPHHEHHPPPDHPLLAGQPPAAGQRLRLWLLFDHLAKQSHHALVLLVAPCAPPPPGASLLKNVCLLLHCGSGVDVQPDPA